MGIDELRDIIILDECGILAVNKPAGYETISTTGGACLTATLKKMLNTRDLEPAHRLDRDTTGVQVFSRNHVLLKELEALFRERKTQKFYLALCAGIPFNAEGTINRALSKWAGGYHPVQVVKNGQGLEAETEYQLLARNRELNCSLILFKPHQGRTHQIRVHAAAFGRPILGDDQYGDREANKKFKSLFGLGRQALHAWRLVLPLPDGENLLLAAPVAADIALACDQLFPDWRQLLTI